MPDWSTAPPYQEHQQRWLCAVSGWKAQALPSRGCLCLEKAQPSIIPLFLSTTPLFFPPTIFHPSAPGNLCLLCCVRQVPGSSSCACVTAFGFQPPLSQH